MARKIQDPIHQKKKPLKISTLVCGREKIIMSYLQRKMQRLLFYNVGKEKNEMTTYLVAQSLIQKSGALYPLFLLIMLKTILI